MAHTSSQTSATGARWVSICPKTSCQVILVGRGALCQGRHLSAQVTGRLSFEGAVAYLLLLQVSDEAGGLQEGLTALHVTGHDAGPDEQILLMQPLPLPLHMTGRWSKPEWYSPSQYLVPVMSAGTRERFRWGWYLRPTWSIYQCLGSWTTARYIQMPQMHLAKVRSTCTAQANLANSSVFMWRPVLMTASRIASPNPSERGRHST